MNNHSFTGISLKLGCLKKPSDTKFWCPGNGHPFILEMGFFLFCSLTFLILLCNLAIRFFELHYTAKPFIMMEGYKH